jgi:hypothetical protein
MAILSTYQQFGGAHAETAGITNALAALGLKDPRTGQPFTEAMLLGIGGGLGAGYILWEFKEHNAKVMILAFRNKWQYPQKYMQALCDRINIRAEFLEAGGRKAATANLENALAQGIPALAWLDPAHQPYLMLPASLQGYGMHFAMVYGLESGIAYLDDLAGKPFTMPAELLADSRGRIGSFKNRLLLLHVDPSATIDLKAAVLAGIEDCVEHLSNKSDSFSLPTFRKLGKMMVDGKNDKGWLKAFADRKGLYRTLKSFYESIALFSSDGGGLRNLYADFLDNAADITGNLSFSSVAGQYRALWSQWGELASAALPESSPTLKRTRELMRQRYELLMAGGDEALDVVRPLVAELDALQAEARVTFPLDWDATKALFEDLSARLLAIYDAEVAALEALRSAALIEA